MLDNRFPLITNVSHTVIQGKNKTRGRFREHFCCANYCAILVQAVCVSYHETKITTLGMVDLSKTLFHIKGQCALIVWEVTVRLKIQQKATKYCFIYR